MQLTPPIERKEVIDAKNPLFPYSRPRFERGFGGEAIKHREDGGRPTYKGD